MDTLDLINSVYSNQSKVLTVVLGVGVVTCRNGVLVNPVQTGIDA